MEKRLLFLTGCPCVGKTTVLVKAADLLKARGWNVGGMISREVREHGMRVGFEILDLGTGRRGWLAHVNQQSGPRIGKYRVNLADLETVGVSAVSKAVECADLVAVDEVGPMELFSEKFRQAVNGAFDCGKPVIGVIHWKADDEFIKALRRRSDAEILSVSVENRGELPNVICEKALRVLSER